MPLDIKKEVVPNFKMEVVSKSPSNGFFQRVWSLTEDLDVVFRYNEFMGKNIMTEAQNDIAYAIAEELLSAECNEVTFDQTPEEKEILIIHSDYKGINFISIDSDGDIMLSITPYQGDGERIFQDNDKIDVAFLVDKLLS
jgi:hypothetical protein